MVYAEVDIYPYPLTNLSITDGTTTITYPHRDLQAAHDHYALEIGSPCALGCTDLTFSADGYQSITKDCYTDTVHTVTLEALPSKPEHLYAYTNASGKTLYAWTVLDTDTINPATYKTIYTSTPTIETGMQTTMDNAYVLVDGALVNVSLSDIVSINGTGGELYVTESNNEYIEMELGGPV